MSEKRLPGLTLSSSYEEIDQLLPYLKKVQKQTPISDDDFNNIRLALNEAVTNAIVHGNHQDATKKVTITASKNDHSLKVSVQDEGHGFDPSSLSNPLNEEQLLKDSGRGIFLIRQLTERLEFALGGAKLIMQFKLDE